MISSNPELYLLPQLLCQSNHFVSLFVAYQASLFVAADIAFLAELVELRDKFFVCTYRERK